jgi:indole-3-glycerol phosphate synthase
MQASNTTNILDIIIARKKEEVALAKRQRPMQQLMDEAVFNRPVLSLKQFLTSSEKTGIIAEFKRKSPSKGIINDTATVADVTAAYTRGGASGLSVLTDVDFFGGSNGDLVAARFNEVPILRKDFVIDEYQIAEARAIGADVILLIAACLTPQRVQELAAYAVSLQLEVLLELHHDAELAHVCNDTALVGINNRNLKTFEVDINRAIALSKQIPADKIKIAESGIHDIATLLQFRREGYHGFLIGENFMKQTDPTIAFANFVHQLNAAAH